MICTSWGLAAYFPISGAGLMRGFAAGENFRDSCEQAGFRRSMRLSRSPLSWSSEKSRCFRN